MSCSRPALLPHLPLQLQRIILLDAAGPPLSSSSHHQVDAEKLSMLARYSRVSKDWMNLAIPRLYSSVVISASHENHPSTFPSPHHPKTALLVRTLRSSPRLADLVVSLHVVNWTSSDFTLLPSLRHFACEETIRSKVTEQPESRPKLWSLSVRVGVVQVDDEDEFEDFDACIDGSELSSLVLTSHPRDFHRSPCFFPSFDLPVLTSLTLQQDPSELADYFNLSTEVDFGGAHALLIVVGAQLLDLAVHDNRPRNNFICHHPDELFILCPNLIRFTYSGPFFPRPLFDLVGSRTLQELVLAIPSHAEDAKKEAQRDLLTLLDMAGFQEFDKATDLPAMKRLVVKGLVFAELGEGDETVRELATRVKDELGWEVVDVEGVSFGDFSLE